MREVARDHGVDESTLDEALDLRKIAAGSSASLARIEAYCDAVPRAAARVEEHGPLRLFVADGVPWPYYARPSGAGAVTATDVQAVRSRQWELGLPETFEWVVDLAPTLGPAARAAGLSVLEVPLMMLEQPPEPPDAGVRACDDSSPTIRSSPPRAPWPSSRSAAGRMPGRASAMRSSRGARRSRSRPSADGWRPA